jgi:diguanylate cyclase (GGDEF)-like protein
MFTEKEMHNFTDLKTIEKEILTGLILLLLTLFAFAIPFTIYLRDFKLVAGQSAYCFILLTNLFLMRRAKTIRIPSLVIFSSSFLMLLLIFFRYGTATIPWIFLLPIPSFFFLGLQRGALVNLLFILIVSTLLMVPTSLNPSPDRFSASITILSYLCISFISFFLEFFRLRIQQRLEEMSVTDSLTGIFNRRHFDTVLLKEIEQAERYEKPFCLLTIDVDHFKEINDGHGHTVGDRVLIDLVILLKTGIRNVDSIFRIGGEEFAILLPETNLNGGLVFAERIRKSVMNHPFVDSIRTTASIGVIQFQQGYTVDYMIKYADRAMYDAKKRGRNRIEVASG